MLDDPKLNIATLNEPLSPAERDRRKLLSLEWLRKTQACTLAGVSRAQWDRYRAAKAAGDPAFANFPNDYRVGSRGRVYFKTIEVVQWLESRKR